MTAEVSTNSARVIEASRRFFPPTVSGPAPAGFVMQLNVDSHVSGAPPWPQPHFRGLNHLIYAGFGGDCALLLDLKRRRALGRFSRAMAQDAAYWRRVVLPNGVGLLSEALGLTALHAACVVRDGVGLLLSGESGAGKSTLALALARSGFAFLSDDWTYFSGRGPRLRAWGTASTVKLLPDAVRHFAELRSCVPGMSANGELAYEFDPEAICGVQRAFECAPRVLVFLNRRRASGFSLTKMAQDEAAARLELELEKLPAHLSALSAAQSRAVRDLAARECWLLRYGEPPEVLAPALRQLFLNASTAAPRETSQPAERRRLFRTAPDIIRRFTPTPLSVDLPNPEGRIRLETNRAAILRLLHGALGSALPPGQAPFRFRWRLVADPIAGGLERRAAHSSLLADGLRLDTFGQHTFCAADAGARLGVGFIDERLLDDARFARSFVSTLKSATSEVLADSV